jgi:hypothetical protein
MSIFPMYPRKYSKTFKISARRPADKRFSENYSFPVQNYSDYCGDMVYIAYRDLIIDESVVVTTENPCKGLYIYCDGDCSINGTLSMTARGAKFNPQGEGFGCKPKCEAFLNVTFSYPYTAEQLEDYIRRYIQSIAENGIPQAVWPSYIINNIYEIPANEEDLATVPAVGANGGASRSTNGDGNPGSNGTDRKSGGGGGGARYYSGTGGAGGAGTAHSGGSGGGGGSYGTGGAGSSVGGAGGNGNGANAGGGAGNPGGKYGTGSGLGTGGLIILIVRGNLTIGATGIIESKGTAGKNAPETYSAGGGGSGGGSINIFYGGTYTKNGSVLATGGDGGTGFYAGGKGGDGCITEQQI